MNADNRVTIALNIARAIEPMLAGHPPEVQGAVLADLLATWIAGHRADDPMIQAGVRKRLMQEHLTAVQSLVTLADMVAAGLVDGVKH